MKSLARFVVLMGLGAACAETPVAPVEQLPIGTLSFVYAGVVNGSFSVQGHAPSLEGMTGWRDPFAYATIDAVVPPPSPVTTVRSSTGSKETSYDNVVLHIPLTSAGTATVTEDCFVPGVVNCPHASLGLSMASGTGRPSYTCLLDTGTFTIAHRTATRVAGTFSGSAECLRLDTLEKSELQVTGGVFDVPIIADRSATSGASGNRHGP